MRLDSLAAVLQGGEFGRTPNAQGTGGLDHEKLTYRFNGRDYRMTDVHGHVVREILERPVDRIQESCD